LIAASHVQNGCMLHGECKMMATSKSAEMLNMVAELLVDGGGNHFLLKMGPESCLPSYFSYK